MKCLQIKMLAIVATGLVALSGCATGPKIRAQTAPGAEVQRYRTYGYLEKLGTDAGTYASALTLNLKAATDREMQSRGFTPATGSPDLVVNFFLDQKEKIEGTSGPSFGLGFGRGWGSWRSGYSWGFGLSDTWIDSRTEGTLTIDVVDRAKNEIVWSGTAVGTVTGKMLDEPRAAIDSIVPKIFAKFPARGAP